MTSPAPLAVTMGEPAGIGGDIMLDAWIKRHDKGLAPFCVIDNAKRLERLADHLGLEIPFAVISAPSDVTAELFHRALPVLNIDLPYPVSPGQPDERNGSAVQHSIDQAVHLAKAGLVSAVVTNPIHKNVLYKSGFKHPGHTEYLASLCYQPTVPVMMLACNALRVIPITIHVSLRKAIDLLTEEAIIETATITAEGLKQNLGLENPRLAFAALNPHAGEGGAMGSEEADIMVPALQKLQDRGIAVSGPHSADTMFHEEARAEYDVALCCYHDQALIPIKTLDFHNGVNVTLGLPFIRTSPDHGTAFGLAGTGKARSDSLIAALKMAGDMAQCRFGKKALS